MTHKCHKETIDLPDHAAATVGYNDVLSSDLTGTDNHKEKSGTPREGSTEKHFLVKSPPPIRRIWKNPLGSVVEKAADVIPEARGCHSTFAPDVVCKGNTPV